jgi:hypothetical protein
MPGFRSDPLPRDPRLAASASLDQFPGTNDSRRPSGLSSGTLQRNASAASLSRMLEPSGQHGTSEQYLSQPRDRLDEDLRHLHNGQQIIPGTSVPDVGSSRSDQYQSASAAVPAASSVYRGFGEPGVVGGLAPSIDAVHPPADSSGDRRPEVAVGFSQTSGEGSNSTAQALPSVQTPAGGNVEQDQFHV